MSVAWSHFPHEGDVGVRGYGAIPAEAFANAARAMTAVLVPLDDIACDQAVGIACAAPDLEVLLVAG
jgi:SHS2 domain-containing protein